MYVLGSEFRWRSREHQLNSYPHFIAEVDKLSVHFIHVRLGGVPLILTHGWPSAFTEYRIDRLAGGARSMDPGEVAPVGRHRR